MRLLAQERTRVTYLEGTVGYLMKRAEPPAEREIEIGSLTSMDGNTSIGKQRKYIVLEEHQLKIFCNVIFQSNICRNQTFAQGKILRTFQICYCFKFVLF